MRSRTLCAAHPGARRAQRNAGVLAGWLVGVLACVLPPDGSETQPSQPARRQRSGAYRTVARNSSRMRSRALCATHPGAQSAQRNAGVLAGWLVGVPPACGHGWQRDAAMPAGGTPAFRRLPHRRQKLVENPIELLRLVHHQPVAHSLHLARRDLGELRVER
ncbi:MAG: hypothetical protein QOC81_2384 [Thermoanaerobaculia bacterium]|nr:hypothetical protein [Thermoanaerobaculia bacterium]